jgi:hypothetical protein
MSRSRRPQVEQGDIRIDGLDRIAHGRQDQEWIRIGAGREREVERTRLEQREVHPIVHRAIARIVTAEIRHHPNDCGPLARAVPIEPEPAAKGGPIGEVTFGESPAHEDDSRRGDVIGPLEVPALNQTGIECRQVSRRHADDAGSWTGTGLARALDPDSSFKGWEARERSANGDRTDARDRSEITMQRPHESPARNGIGIRTGAEIHLTTKHAFRCEPAEPVHRPGDTADHESGDHEQRARKGDLTSHENATRATQPKRGSAAVFLEHVPEVDARSLSRGGETREERGKENEDGCKQKHAAIDLHHHEERELL